MYNIIIVIFEIPRLAVDVIGGGDKLLTISK